MRYSMVTGIRLTWLKGTSCIVVSSRSHTASLRSVDAAVVLGDSLLQMRS